MAMEHRYSGYIPGMDQPRVIYAEVPKVWYLRGNVQGHLVDILPVLHCLRLMQTL